MSKDALTYYEILRQITTMVTNVGTFADPPADAGDPGTLFGHVTQAQQQIDNIRIDDISDSAKPAEDLDGTPAVAIIPALRWIRNILMDSTAVSRVGDSTDAAFPIDGAAHRSIFQGLHFLSDVISTIWVGLGDSNQLPADLDGTGGVSLFQGLRWIRNILMDSTAVSRVGDSTQAAADLDGTAHRSIFQGLRYIRDLITTLLAGGIRVTTKTLTNIGTNSGDHTVFTANGGAVGVLMVSVKATGALSAKYLSQAITGNGTTSSLLTDAQTTPGILSGANKQAMWTGNGGAIDLTSAQVVNTNVKGSDNTETVTFVYRALWIAYDAGATLV